MDKILINNNNLFKVIIDELASGKKVSFKVKGNSMLPFFRDTKTLIELKKTNTYKKYDVILFKLENKYYVHRILKIKENRIICMGDALISKEIINESNIIARVISYQNKKLINTNSKKYKIRVTLWMLLRPIRRLIVKIIRWSNG